MKKEMSTHSCTLAWKIPRAKEPGNLQSMGLQRVKHDWATLLSLHFQLTLNSFNTRSKPGMCDGSVIEMNFIRTHCQLSTSSPLPWISLGICSSMSFNSYILALGWGLGKVDWLLEQVPWAGLHKIFHMDSSILVLVQVLEERI